MDFPPQNQYLEYAAWSASGQDFRSRNSSGWVMWIRPPEYTGSPPVAREDYRLVLQESCLKGLRSTPVTLLQVAKTATHLLSLMSFDLLSFSFFAARHVLLLSFSRI
jgi:hypothetical protein